MDWTNAETIRLVINGVIWGGLIFWAGMIFWLAHRFNKIVNRFYEAALALTEALNKFDGISINVGVVGPMDDEADDDDKPSTH